MLYSDPRRCKKTLPMSDFEVIFSFVDLLYQGGCSYRVDLLEWIHKWGSVGWISQGGSIRVDQLGWISQGGSIRVDHQGESVRVDQLGWISQGGSIGVDQLGWISQGGSIRVDQLGWINQGGSIRVDPLGWMYQGGSNRLNPEVRNVVALLYSTCTFFCFNFPLKNSWNKISIFSRSIKC